MEMKLDLLHFQIPVINKTKTNLLSANCKYFSEMEIIPSENFYM
jgi:hypothetical protein